MILFLFNISKKIKGIHGHYASMNTIFFHHFREEMLCNNTQLQLLRETAEQQGGIKN